MVEIEEIPDHDNGVILGFQINIADIEKKCQKNQAVDLIYQGKRGAHNEIPGRIEKN